LCHGNALHFDKAVKSIRAYVSLMEKKEQLADLAQAQAKTDLDTALMGIEGTMPIELPKDAPGSPTTDRQGESEKEMW
jgi:hypothetical protein